MQIVQLILISVVTSGLVFVNVALGVQTDVIEDVIAMIVGWTLIITDILLLIGLILLVLSNRSKTLSNTLDNCCVRQPLAIYLIIVDSVNLAASICGIIALHGIYGWIYASAWYHLGMNLVAYLIICLQIRKH